MANYSIISDISTYLVELLREKMCPEPLPQKNNIQVTTPLNQETDYLLGIYLYDISGDKDIVAAPGLTAGKIRNRYPPKPYVLSYMIFPNISERAGLKELEMQRIIGRAVQIINDNDSIFPNELEPWLQQTEPVIHIQEARVDLDEKVKIWQAINKPYQISYFYKVSTVYLSSEKVIDSTRVTEAQFGIHMREEER